MINRRDFVKSAVAAGALAGGSAGIAPAATTGMFVALSSALTGNKVQWPESARLAARVGYGGIDLNLGPAMKEGVDATRTLLTELKLRTSFCSLPYQRHRHRRCISKGHDDAGRFREIRFRRRLWSHDDGAASRAVRRPPMNCARC